MPRTGREPPYRTFEGLTSVSRTGREPPYHTIEGRTPVSRTGREPPYHTREFGRRSPAYASDPKNLSSTLSVSDEADLLTTLTERNVKLEV